MQTVYVSENFVGIVGIIQRNKLPWKRKCRKLVRELVNFDVSVDFLVPIGA